MATPVGPEVLRAEHVAEILRTDRRAQGHQSARCVAARCLDCWATTAPASRP